MSDTPGSNLNPRDRRGGERPRNRNRSRNNNNNNRRHRDDEPRERRDNPRPRRDRDRPRRENKPAPVAAKPTFGQKLLAILTFGLVRPRKKAPARPAPRQDATRAMPRKESVPVPPADPESITSERLHIGNLHYDASERDLLDIFKGIGPVQDVDIVYNGRTHRSKGFGFVTFMALDDARRAVADLHGKPFMGRKLILGPARSRGADEREADTPDTPDAPHQPGEQR